MRYRSVNEPVATARDFLSELSRDSQGQLAIWDLPDKHTEFFSPAEVGAATEYALGLTWERHNLYVVSNALRDGIEKGRGKASDVVEILAVRLDLDITGPGHKNNENLWPDEATALDWLTKALPPPTVLVLTGGGIQPWWFLDRPYPASDPSVSTLNKDFTAAAISAAPFAIDPTGSNEHAFRLPGTKNWKTAPSRLVEVKESDYSRRYTSEEIWAAIETLRPTATPSRPENGKRRSRHAGEPISDGVRNISLTSMAGSMRRIGFSENAINAALQVEDRSECEVPLGTEEVAGIAHSIGQYATPGRSVLETRRLGDVAGEPIEWLVRPLVPLGELTVVYGPPGSSKGYVLQHVISCTTRGKPLAEGIEACPKGSVLVFSAEESYSKVFKQRAVAARTRQDRVHLIDGVRIGEEQTQFTIEHLALIQHHLRVHGDTKLVVIDPVDAITPKTNTIANNRVRHDVMGPLQRLAEEFDVAVMLVMHPRKEFSTDALHQIAGSVAYAAAVRSALLIKKHKLDDGANTRLLLPVKTNLVPDDELIGLEYDIEDNRLQIRRIITDHAEIETLTKPHAPQRSKEEDNEAADWITQQLSEGPRPLKDLRIEAAAHGFSGRQFDRVLKSLEGDQRLRRAQEHVNGHRGAGPVMVHLRPTP
jgi:AAA domain/Primase C terminal 1 (PriCT-1)